MPKRKVSPKPRPVQKLSNPRRHQSDGTDNLLITAWGASSGGLEALEQCFKHLPDDSGMAFVIVQHLAPDHTAPDHTGALPELLARCTQMRVEQARNNVEVAPNRVYIIPPETTLTIEGRKLRVARPAEPRGKRTPIDSFFRSLARERGENAVCILLSGTGTDGTLGLREIKENGGMAMAQTLESASYHAILRSAIETGLVDHILPVEEMPGKLLEYAAHLRSLSSKPNAFQEQIGTHLGKIHLLLQRRTGHDFSHYKESTIARRLERRMKAVQIDTVEQYAQTLERQPEEADRLFKDLLIGVTQFFRDPGAFEALGRKVIPKLFEGKDSTGEVRAAVIGCASGEEAYSIAMLLHDHASKLNHAPRIKVFATDIDERGLQFARRGVYPEAIAEQIDPERLERFFIRKDHVYQVKRELRDICIFSNHNFIKDPLFSRLGLISCRNVLIYLGPELQQEILPVFHYALRPGGYMFLGPSETASGHAELFRVLDKKYRIYQKKETVARSVLQFSHPDIKNLRRPDEKPSKPEGRNLPRQLERMILQRYRPACVAVSENGDAVYFSGRTSRYLEQPTGSPEANVLNMAREGLQIPLRMALHRAAATHKPAVEKNISVRTSAGISSVDVTVEPLADLSPPNLYMIAFEETAIGNGSPPGLPPTEVTGLNARSEETIRQLESELRAARELAQATFEEFETTNEELKSANEEYQSTNEELENSKEELQSLNEELETINTELSQKVRQLDESKSVLQNLFNATQIATIFLDSELRIRSFTPAAVDMFRLIPSDVGRPITDLATRFSYDDFAHDVAEVLQKVSSRERQLAGESGRHYQMRMLPYRTVHDVIDGVVITFTDVTALSEAEQRALEAKTFADSIVQTVREPLLVLDADLRVHSANASFYETFRVTPEETRGRVLYDLGNREWNIPGLRRLLVEILPRHGSFEDFRVEHEFTGIGPRTMLLNARIVRQHRAGAPLILLAIEDISGRVEIERSREQELESRRALAERLMKAQEDERRRIARDLHDDLAQQLALLEIDIQTIQQKPPADRISATRVLEPVRRRVCALSDQVRAISHDLHPAILDDLGLKAALRNLVQDFARIRNLVVRLKFDDLRRQVPLPITMALYRIVQEALQNIAKHAPDSRTNILVEPTSEGLRLLVKDDGPGFDLTGSQGLGIISMQERARQVGGKWEIQSRPGHGTRITVVVPWSDENQS